MYGSSRGSGVVVLYSLKEDDSLVREEEINLAGTWPRSMAINRQGNLMVVIDQYGDSVQIVEIDLKTGRLYPGPVYETPSQPAFVDFME